MPFIVSDPVTLLIWAILGYLFGSIPSGMILARVMNLGNLREIGSGNIGATNVLRTGNKAAAALTLLFDAAKAMIPLLLARHFAGEDAAQLAALAAFLGHCFPVWLKFRGGKGVATLAFTLRCTFRWVLRFAPHGSFAQQYRGIRHYPRSLLRAWHLSGPHFWASAAPYCWALCWVC